MHVRHKAKSPPNLIKRAIFILKSRANQRPGIAFYQNKCTHKRIIVEGTFTPQISIAQASINAQTNNITENHQQNHILHQHPSISQLLNCQIMRNIRSRARVLSSKTPKPLQRKTPEFITSRNSCCLQRGFNYDTLLPWHDRRSTYTIADDISAW
jgi:hypothetical protein